MSRLADRAKSYPLASFGAALLPPELGGPLPAQFVQRVDRYVTRLPATSRFAVRAGLASLAAASYLTTGRSLPRLHPDERARVLHRIAALPVNQLIMVKLALNSALLQQGVATSRMVSTVFDGAARHTPEGHAFVADAVEHGFRDAVRRRDEPFGDYGRQASRV